MRYSSLFLVSVLFLTGCATVTEGDKLVHEQQFHIGNFVMTHASDPAVIQAGKDGAENAKTLLGNQGAPTVPAGKYTPELSAQYRKQSTDEHQAESKIFSAIKGVVGQAFPWVIPVISLLTAGVAVVRKQIQNKKMNALYAGVNDVIRDVKGIKNGEGVDLSSAVKNTMKTVATAHNVWVSMNSDLNKLKKKGILKPV